MCPWSHRVCAGEGPDVARALGDGDLGFLAQTRLRCEYSRTAPTESPSLVHPGVYDGASIFALCVSFPFIRMYSLVFLFFISCKIDCKSQLHLPIDSVAVTELHAP